VACLGSGGTARAASGDITVRVESDRQPLWGRETELRIQALDDRGQPVDSMAVELQPEGRWRRAEDGARLETLSDLRTDVEGRLTLPPVILDGGGGRFRVTLSDGRSGWGEVRVVHAPWVLLPPILSIVLALWLRQVLLALAAGVFGGAWILYGDPLHAFLHGLAKIVVGSVTDPFQGAILIFTSALGGMVGVMARSGGTHGVVEAASRYIRGPKSAQLMTAVMGLIIFFDDYANTLLVGNTMRPVTDRLRVSREKLSYLVDCTAAPVATVALLSTWVGYQVGLIADGLQTIGRSPNEAYATFVGGVPFAFYSWFALSLVFVVVFLNRDFGSMYTAEQRCRRSGAVLREGARPLVDDVGQDLAPPPGKPLRAHQALIPILVVLIATAAGLYYDGRSKLLEADGPSGLPLHGLRDIFSAADPASALLWAVALGSLLAIALAVGERILDLHTAMEAWVSGAKAMLPALCILVLAWSIGSTCETLGTGAVVVDWATGAISARLVPSIAFVVAAFLGFSTGTSWGTMAILMPIVIPLAHELPAAAGLAAGPSQSILLASIASVLSGSVFGDHCSPISDTTIMSSMASGADHVDHVRTQIPYALMAGAMAVLVGTLPAGWGVPPWLTIPVGVALLWGVVRVFGRRVEDGLDVGGAPQGPGEAP
jgi:Na+/H+ antiporter NhaC